MCHWRKFQTHYSYTHVLHIHTTHTYYTHTLHTLTDEVPHGGQLHIHKLGGIFVELLYQKTFCEVETRGAYSIQGCR